MTVFESTSKFANQGSDLMRRNIKCIVSFFLALFLLIPCVVIGDTGMEFDYRQDGNNLGVFIKAEGNRPLSITVKDETRYYYINQGVTDNVGKIEFKFFLEEEKEYDCQVNTDGNTLLKQIITKKSNQPIEPEKPREDGVDLYIRGYGATILDKQDIVIRDRETVLDLTTRILAENGISYESKNGYMVSIDGQKEFDKGKDSGWMFTVNGVFMEVGAGSVRLEDGDRISWVYTHDMGKDVGNIWVPETLTTIEADRTIEASIQIENDKASASVNLEDLTNIIARVKDSGQAIIIAPKDGDKVKTIEISLPKEGLNQMVKDSSSPLVIKTGLASVTMPNATISSIVSQAKGARLVLVIDKVNKAVLTEIQDKTIKNAEIFDISLISASDYITSFGGENIAISLPYVLLNDEKAEDVNVWHLDDEKQLNRLDSSYDKETEFASFETPHLSYFLVGTLQEGAHIEDEEELSMNFIDVGEDDWFYKAVEFVVKNGLFRGVSETSFAPNQAMTRAMLARVIYKMEGTPDELGENIFDDVGHNLWYTDAILWANANKIVSGYGNGKFGTDDPITREQIAVILYKYARYKGYNIRDRAELDSYIDAADISIWAEEAMSWANANGLISGRSRTMLAPKADASRAELASILQGFIESFTQ